MNIDKFLLRTDFDIMSVGHLLSPFLVQNLLLYNQLGSRECKTKYSFTEFLLNL
jgi:hypothetical protein